MTQRFSTARMLGVFAALVLFGSAPSIASDQSSGEGSYTGKVRTVSKFLDKDFMPDANLSKGAWKTAKWVRFDHDPAGHPRYPQALTEVASLWNDRYIYFAFRSRYTTLNTFEGEDPVKERWELWTRDVVEVFVNPQPEHLKHYYEFEVSPNNQWIDLEIDKSKDPFTNAPWNSNFDHATKIDEKTKVWTCEMRIPLHPMQVSAIHPGEEWRLNFYRMDGPGENSQRRAMCWSTIPQSKSFHEPTRFGIIRLVK